MFTVVALGPATCLTNGTRSQLTTVNKKRIIDVIVETHWRHYNVRMKIVIKTIYHKLLLIVQEYRK